MCNLSLYIVKGKLDVRDVSIEPLSDIKGTFVNVIDIGPGDLEQILGCAQRLDIAKEVIIRGLKVVQSTVSGWLQKGT